MPYTRRRSYSKKKRSPLRNYRRRRSSTSSLINLIKKTSIQTAEQKVATRLFSSLTNPGHLTLAHNQTHYELNLLRSTQSVHANPGTQVIDNRIGAEIWATGLKIRMQLINAPTQSNVTYKYFVFWYPSERATMTDPDFWCGTDGNGGNMNRLLDFPDYRDLKIIKTGVIPTASRTANMNQAAPYSTAEHPYILGDANLAPRMHTTLKDIWIPLKRKIVYDGNNSPVPKFKDIGLAVLAYDVNNTEQGTPIGYLDFTSRLYFRDP